MDPLKKRKLEENGVVLPDLTIEDARKILEPLTHEQLFEIVQNSLLRHPDVLDAVRSVADRDPTQRKLFIRGLGWETTTEKLRALFSQYGELEEAVVILDKATGKSKGYGFVTFKHIDGSLRALKQPSKQIDGRMAMTQLAAAGVSGGGAGGGINSVDVSLRKIYVANVPYDMPGERLLQYFSMYGEIEEGPLGFDKATGKSKGFALFVYKTAEAARASLFNPVKNIDGHQLNCKLANDGKKGKPGVGGPGGVQGGGANVQGNGVGSGIPVGGQYGGPGGVGGMSSYTGYSGVNPVGGNPLSSTVGSGGGAAAAAAGALGVGGSSGFSSGLGGHYGGASHFGGPGSTGYGGLSGAGAGLSGIGGGLGGAVAGVGALGGPGSVLGGTGAGLGGAGGGLGGAGSGLGGAGGGLGGAGSGLGGAGGGLGVAGSGLGGAGGGLSGIGSGLGGGRGSLLYGVGPGSAGMPSGEYPQNAHYSLSSSSAYQNQHHQAAGTSPAPRGLYQGMPPYY